MIGRFDPGARGRTGGSSTTRRPPPQSRSTHPAVYGEFATTHWYDSRNSPTNWRSRTRRSRASSPRRRGRARPEPEVRHDDPERAVVVGAERDARDERVAHDADRGRRSTPRPDDRGAR